MSFPLIETPIGTVNGSNREFRVRSDYQSGTTRVFRNGVLLEDDLQDGWVELGGKRIRLKKAPKKGDVLQVYYLPIS